MIRQLIEQEIRNVITGDSEPPTEQRIPGGYKIVIAQRGFVFAGDCEQVGDYIVLTNAVNIRRWGTSKGLGELAQDGNQPETKADHAGTVRLHQLAVVAMLDCEGRINATT